MANKLIFSSLRKPCSQGSRARLILLSLSLIFFYFISGQSKSIESRASNIKNIVVEIKSLGDFQVGYSVPDVRARVIIRRQERFNVDLKPLSLKKFWFTKEAIQTDNGFVIDSDKLGLGSKMRIKINDNVYPFVVERIGALEDYSEV